jgi:CHASE2 domain-containing sensor protein
VGTGDPRLSGVHGPVTRTNGPYLGLDYFREQDAELFFGRDAERKRIVGNLRASRLTLLHAESGVGKSSLLRAGVAARMRRLAAASVTEGGAAPYVPVVYSDWRGDPTTGLAAALEAAVQPLLSAGVELAVPRDSLEHAIETVAAVSETTPLFILDRFEDRLHVEPVDGFDDELANCINRRDLRVHFLLSIREDAYSLIGDRFKARIPNVYGNYLRLDFLDARAAHKAIVEPVRAFNEQLSDGAPPITVEPELVDAVLKEVRRGRVTIGDDGAPAVPATARARIETAYLQLVMTRLWNEEVASGSFCLRLETLQRLGGADTIVGAHLDDAMAILAPDQRDAAAAAFRFLVTSSGRKIALSTAELREFSNAPVAPLESALEHLEQSRILRPIPSAEPGGERHREIYHDVLAPAILDWRRRYVEEQRRAATERGLAHERARAQRLELRNRRLAAAVVALATVTVALAVYVWNPEPVRRLELSSVDARFSLRGARTPDPRLVLVTVDDPTLARLDQEGRGTLRRGEYAKLLERLNGDRPAVIALDVIFKGPRDRAGDNALLNAFAATRDRLVLPFDGFQVVEDDRQRQVLQPDLLGHGEAVRATGVRTGFAGLPDDEDGHDRRADYVVATTADIDAPSFAFAAADVAMRGGLSRRRDDLPVAQRRAWGGQSDRTTWIDFQGPPGTVRRVSALNVLDGRVAAGAFTDKLVVIGVVTRASPDVHRTPLSSKRAMPGPEVQANALDTMVNHSSLRDAPLVVNLAALILLACIPAAASLTRSVPRVAIALAATTIGFLLLAQLGFDAGRIVTMVVPLLALLVGTATVILLRGMPVVRRRLSQSTK